MQAKKQSNEQEGFEVGVALDRQAQRLLPEHQGPVALIGSTLK